MSAHNTSKVTLSIPNAGSDSPWLSSILSLGQMKAVLGSVVHMIIYTPAALTNAITVQVVPTEGDTSGKTLQTSAGTDLTLAAGKAVVVPASAFKDMRIHSAGAEAGQRDFDVVIQVDTSF